MTISIYTSRILNSFNCLETAHLSSQHWDLCWKWEAAPVSLQIIWNLSFYFEEPNLDFSFSFWFVPHSFYLCCVMRHYFNPCFLLLAIHPTFHAKKNIFSVFASRASRQVQEHLYVFKFEKQRKKTGPGFASSCPSSSLSRCLHSFSNLTRFINKPNSTP